MRSAPPSRTAARSQRSGRAISRFSWRACLRASQSPRRTSRLQAPAADTIRPPVRPQPRVLTNPTEGIRPRPGPAQRGVQGADREAAARVASGRSFVSVVFHRGLGPDRTGSSCLAAGEVKRSAHARDMPNARTPLTPAQIRKVYPVRLIPPIRTVHSPLLSLLYSALAGSGRAGLTGAHSVHRRPMPPPRRANRTLTTQGVRDPQRRVEDGAGAARRPSAAGEGRQEQVEPLISDKVSAWPTGSALSAMPRAREQTQYATQNMSLSQSRRRRAPRRCLRRSVRLSNSSSRATEQQSKKRKACKACKSANRNDGPPRSALGPAAERASEAGTRDGDDALIGAPRGCVDVV